MPSTSVSKASRSSGSVTLAARTTSSTSYQVSRRWATSSARRSFGRHASVAVCRYGLGVAIAPELAVVDTSTSPDASGTRLVRLTDSAHTRRGYATRRTTDPNPFLPQAIALPHTAAAALPERGEGECPVVTG